MLLFTAGGFSALPSLKNLHLPAPLLLVLGGRVLRARSRSGPGSSPRSGRARPRVRPGPGARLVSEVGLDLQPAAVKLEVVLALEGAFDAAPVAELDDAFAGARGVRVGVADLAGVAKEILQVLKREHFKRLLDFLLLLGAPVETK